MAVAVRRIIAASRNAFAMRQRSVLELSMFEEIAKVFQPVPFPTNPVVRYVRKLLVHQSKCWWILITFLPQDNPASLDRKMG
jgi:hypothetical protein